MDRPVFFFVGQRLAFSPRQAMLFFWGVSCLGYACGTGVALISRFMSLFCFPTIFDPTSDRFFEELSELWAIAVGAPHHFWPLGKFRVGLITEIQAHKNFKNTNFLKTHQTPLPFGTQRKVVGKG
jgi:hypothetical protein